MYLCEIVLPLTFFLVCVMIVWMSSDLGALILSINNTSWTTPNNLCVNDIKQKVFLQIFNRDCWCELAFFILFTSSRGV